MHVIEDDLAFALLDLAGFLNSPRQDDVLRKAAGVSLDRALFPVLARIGLRGTTSVVDLADEMGRDSSTVSRQGGETRRDGLVARREGDAGPARARGHDDARGPARRRTHYPDPPARLRGGPGRLERR
ncbi:MAG: hypothetical protein WDN06_15005 [Asticcacaulis sp.]